MEGNNFEQRRSPERGTNVTLVIDLLRHPEKDYSTGNLTDAGKAAFLEKLREEFAETAFDTIKGYVSPLKRGQQAMEPLSQYLKEVGIDTTIRTKNELAPKTFLDQYTSATDQALNTLVQKRSQLDVSTPGGKENVTEPSSKDEETLKNELIIQEFFDTNLPESEIKGQDIGEEIDSLMQHFARMSSRLLSESKVKLVLVGHSGIIEHLTKLIYLQNHPEVSSSEIGVEHIGGLLDYMTGPQITISSDVTGKQTARFRFKDLSLDYSLKNRILD